MDRPGEGTTFSIDRKIFSSDIWFSSPWKLKIWIYLLGHANHKDAFVMGEKLKRGQLIRSYRTIANDCAYKVGYRIKKPSLDTVRRCCEELTKELRIVRRTVQVGTLFTVCNYSELQPQPKQRTVRRTKESSYSDRTVTVQDKNVKNVNKEEHIPKNGVPYSDIVAHLNQKANTKYQPGSNATQRLIKARWNEGFRLDDFKKVIDGRCAKWLPDERMVDYLRPQTLFGTKFESYLNTNNPEEDTGWKL